MNAKQKPKEVWSRFYCPRCGRRHGFVLSWVRACTSCYVKAEEESRRPLGLVDQKGDLLSARAFNRLLYAGIGSPKNLRGVADADLLKVGNLGKKTLLEIKEVFPEYYTTNKSASLQTLQDSVPVPILIPDLSGEWAI